MRLQKLIVILAAVWMTAFCHGLERDTADVLIPYRLNGKIGFVNQNLEKITEAKYTGCRDENYFFSLIRCLSLPSVRCQNVKSRIFDVRLFDFTSNLIETFSNNVIKSTVYLIKV